MDQLNDLCGYKIAWCGYRDWNQVEIEKLTTWREACWTR